MKDAWENFYVKVRMVDEHRKLYNFICVTYYILVFPLVILFFVNEKVSDFVDWVEGKVISLRSNIIKFVFYKIYKE